MASAHQQDQSASFAPASPTAERWVRRLAWVLCGVTFVLLWVGGLVTTTKAGMAVPDWPDTYGYNLFLYPWSSWLYGPWDLFVEHGHRLLGSLAGILTIALAILLWRYDRRRWMQLVGWVALASVIAQGVLGGARVVEADRLLAMVHGWTGPAFFALTVALVVWTSRTWHTAGSGATHLGARHLLPLALVSCILVYLQMAVGALLRHMPVSASPQSFTTAVQAHLLMAAVVTLAGGAVTRRAVRSGMPGPLRKAGLSLLLLLVIQLTLGVATWLAKYNAPGWADRWMAPSANAIVSDGWWQTHVVTAHQATGSLLLASTLVTALFAWRMAPQYAATTRPVAAGAGPSERLAT